MMGESEDCLIDRQSPYTTYNIKIKMLTKTRCPFQQSEGISPFLISSSTFFHTTQEQYTSLHWKVTLIFMSYTKYLSTHLKCSYFKRLEQYDNQIQCVGIFSFLFQQTYNKKALLRQPGTKIKLAIRSNYGIVANFVGCYIHISVRVKNNFKYLQVRWYTDWY